MRSIVDIKKSSKFIIRYTCKNDDKKYDIYDKEFRYNKSNKKEVRAIIEAKKDFYIDKDMRKRKLAINKDESSFNVLFPKYIKSKKDEDYHKGMTELVESVIKIYLMPLYQKHKLENEPIDKSIDKSFIEEVYECVLGRKNKYGEPISINRRAAAIRYIRDFYKYCNLNGYLNYNEYLLVVNILKKPRNSHETGKMRKEYYTIDEMKKFFSTFDTEDTKWKLYFQVQYFGGLRMAEVNGLKFKDVNFTRCFINIHAQLNKHGEYIPYPKTKGSEADINYVPTIINELKRMKEEMLATDEDYVFFGEKTSATTVTRVLDKHEKLAGLQHHGSHVFRHSYCVLLFSSKEYNDEQIRQKMRHSSISVTHAYYSNFFGSDSNLEEKDEKLFNSVFETKEKN